jgi:hypothetical protein
MAGVVSLRSTENMKVGRGTGSKGTTRTSQSPVMATGCLGTWKGRPLQGKTPTESRDTSRGTGSRGTTTTPCSTMQGSGSGCSDTRGTWTSTQTPSAPSAPSPSSPPPSPASTSPPPCSTPLRGRRAATKPFQKPAVDATLPPPSSSTTTAETPEHPLDIRVEPGSILGQPVRGDNFLERLEPGGRKMTSGTSSTVNRGAVSGTSTSSSSTTASGSIRNRSGRKIFKKEARKSNTSTKKKNQETYLSGSRLETRLEASLTTTALLQGSRTTSGDAMQSWVMGKGARSLISPVLGQTNYTLCATATISCRTAILSGEENTKTTATFCSETTDQSEEDASAYGIRMPLASTEMDRDWTATIRSQSGQKISQILIY